MPLSADAAALKEAINEEITTQTDENSIPPETVGGNMVAIVELIEEYIDPDLPQISDGSTAPDNLFGNDDDEYYQYGNPLVIWRKEGGIWLEKASLPNSLTFPDGNFTVKTTLFENIVTATPGFWFIANNQYSKATQTQFTVSEADTLELRYDIIVANTSNTLVYIEGTRGLPQPETPDNTVLVDVVVIPSVSSGSLPYLYYGVTQTEAPPTTVLSIGKTSADVDSNGNIDISGDGVDATKKLINIMAQNDDGDLIGQIGAYYNYTQNRIEGLFHLFGTSGRQIEINFI